MPGTKRITRLNIAIVIVVGSVMAVPVARGEAEPEMTFELPRVEIVGRHRALLEEIPGSTHVVDEETIEQTKPLSVKDLLRAAPGIRIPDEDVLGRRLNVGVRGLNPRRSARMLLLEDGAPIQLAPYGDPSSHYSPHPKRIGRIEVLKGSGQILHGPQTVGGVLNFVTAEPPARPGATLSGAFGTRDYADGHLRLGGTWDRLGAMADYLHQETDGNRDGQRQRVDEVAVKSVVGLEDRHRLTLKAVVTNETAHMGEAGLPRDLFRQDPRANPLRADRFFVDRYAGQGVHEIALADGWTLATNLYGHYMSRESVRQANDSSGLNNCPLEVDATDLSNAPLCGNEQRPREYAVYGIEPRLGIVHSLLGLPAKATIGIRGHRETAQRRRFAGNRGPRDRSRALENLAGRNRYQDDRIRSDAVAFFLQERLHAGHFTLTPGLRLEHVRLRNQNRISGASDRDDMTELLPGFGATYTGVRSTTLFAGVHRGFAPPRPDDVLDPGRDVLNRVDPETSINWEAGARAEPVPGLRGEVTYFRIDFEDQIVAETLPGGEDRFINAGDTRHQGVELGLRADSAGLAGTAYDLYAQLGWTFVDAVFTSSVPAAGIVSGNRLPEASRHLFHAAVGYESTWGFGVRWDVHTVGRRFADLENTREVDETGQRGILPGHVVLNAAARYAVTDRLDIHLSARNLADRVFVASRVDGIQVGQRRQVIGGVSWTF